MIDATNLSVDNKAVKWMTFNGSIVYSTTEDQTLATISRMNNAMAYSPIDTGSYVPPGDTAPYSYSIYTNDMPYVGFTQHGSGNLKPFAISPHVFVRAKHYGGTVSTFDINTITYTVREQVALSAWCEDNNVAVPAGCGDIELLWTNEGMGSEVVPCLMPKMMMQGLFHRDSLKGEVGYCATQIEDAGQPIIFTNDKSNGVLRWSTPKMLASLLPDTADTGNIKAAPATYLGTGGDSGKPVFIRIGGNLVVVSHNWQIEKPAFSPTAPYYMTGPDYTIAFPALKAYVESKGDTIKTLED
jgi:hypothetical protein